MDAALRPTALSDLNPGLVFLVLRSILFGAVSQIMPYIHQSCPRYLIMTTWVCSSDEPSGHVIQVRHVVVMNVRGLGNQLLITLIL